MPWSNNSGGPWGSGGGGGGGKSPWGGNNGGGGGGGGRDPQQNIDELFRQGQERMKSVFGGGGKGGGGGGKMFSRGGLLIGAIVLIGFWVLQSVFEVDTGEEAVVTRFGEFSRVEGPGLNLALWPIEQAEILPVTRVNRVDIGFRSGADQGRRDLRRDVPEESLMLTGDENIIDIQFSVLWRIGDAPNYLFNVSNPDETVKAVAESAMREVVGRLDAEFIRGRGRDQVMQQVEALTQSILEEYQAGVQITEIQLDKADPPPAVIDSFRDVQAAQQDQERLKNEADAYRNRKSADARGESAELLQQAEAYRAQLIAEAQGEAARFRAIYDQYKTSKEVVRERMYLETMERVLGNMNKIIIDEGAAGSQGVVPYLPLDQLNRQQGTQ